MGSDVGHMKVLHTKLSVSEVHLTVLKRGYNEIDEAAMNTAIRVIEMDLAASLTTEAQEASKSPIQRIDKMRRDFVTLVDVPEGQADDRQSKARELLTSLESTEYSEDIVLVSRLAVGKADMVRVDFRKGVLSAAKAGIQAFFGGV